LLIRGENINSGQREKKHKDQISGLQNVAGQPDKDKFAIKPYGTPKLATKGRRRRLHEGCH
jgi:hypothetical protein